MIVYFSGTGNSHYIAKAIANTTKQSLVNMGELLKYSKTLPDNPSAVYVFVAPVYCWKLPRIVESFIRRASFPKGAKAYFVLTAGLASGNANKYIHKLCNEKGIECMGCSCITMPENYIALFKAPTEDEEKRIIAKADKAILPIANAIAQGEKIEDIAPSPMGFLFSGLVNETFYNLIIKDKKFWVNDDCISCGICEKACMLNNIKLVDGKPKWLGQCTHCMACINLCPKQAINYGKGTIKKRRYYLKA